MNSAEQIAADIVRIVRHSPLTADLNSIAADKISALLKEHEQAIRAEYKALAAEWRGECPRVNSEYSLAMNYCAGKIEGIK